MFEGTHLKYIDNYINERTPYSARSLSIESLPRKIDSYVVAVPGKTAKQKTKLYWPKVPFDT
jgi:hypothetical protein